MNFLIYHAWHIFSRNTMLFMKRDVIGIHSIFQKDRNSNYTKPALLYQDILRYSIHSKSSINVCHIRHWDLARWLMKKNQEFINHYKDPSTRNTTINNRIENTQQRTKGKIKDLIELGLMKQIGTVKRSKGTGIVPIYEYKPAGYLFAYIMQSFDPKKKEDAEKQIYGLLHDSLFKISENSQSDVLFYSRYFRKLDENNVFGNFFSYIRELLDSGRRIQTLRLFFQYAMLPYYKDGNGVRFFVKLWSDTVNELEPILKELVLHSLKLGIEDKMHRQVEDIKTFEKMRLRLKDKPDHLVLECFCIKCKFVTCWPIHLLGYMEAMAYADVSPIVITCPRCKAMSLEVPQYI
jgi:hypothetical protein